MEWRRVTTLTLHVLMTGPYLAVVWQPDGSDSWHSQVLHRGQVVRMETFPMLLVAQASCIVQILALQRPAEQLTPRYCQTRPLPPGRAERLVHTSALAPQLSQGELAQLGDVPRL